MRLFISYAHDDLPVIRQLADFLRSGGHEVWYDQRLVGGKPWKDQLLAQIKAADRFLYALTPKSVASDWCQWEFAQAVHAGKPVATVLLKETSLSGVLAEHQYVDFRDRTLESAIRLGSAVYEAVAILPEKVKLLPAPNSEPERPTDPGHGGETVAQRFFDDAYAAFRDKAYEDARELVLLCLDLAPAHPGALALLKRLEGRATPPAKPPAPANPVEAALQRARAFTGKRNRDWEPFVATFADLKIPDMPFCLVPVGAFKMGSGDGHYSDEEPVHDQRIEQPYWIGQYPVTNAQWKLAVLAGVVKQPYDMGSALKWYADSAMAHAPVVGIDWFMARDFAAWMGCHLPSELEWEYAARGVESLRYPWGDKWDPNIPVWSENSGGKPAVVTSRPEGKSWTAAWHMIGNVWEWTNSLYEPYPYQARDRRELDAGSSTAVRRVLRGGSGRDDVAVDLRSACRLGLAPSDGGGGRGFRCTRFS